MFSFDVLITYCPLISGDILLVFFSDSQDIALIQIPNSLVPGTADPSDNWHNCKRDLSKCTPDQLSIVQGEQFLFLTSSV